MLKSLTATTQNKMSFIHIFNIIMCLNLVSAVISSEPMLPPTGKKSWNTNIPKQTIVTSHVTLSNNDPSIVTSHPPLHSQFHDALVKVINGGPPPRPPPTPQPAPPRRPPPPPITTPLPSS
ncbi:hypothetical protein Lalb_Chr22g0353881 [Lupinus albus]|uniref:Uncharacterized protein n=1 Tax=Lupinus albus TaxID=3870 RepID=A0A6A4NP10_LUPAL|nr:hypothetical protein Lalb_Chr22g0353881 [Lupinus albus]